MSIGGRPVLAHAATVAVTLLLVAVLFGDRLGLRRPPLAQIPGGPNERVAPVPPAPLPISPSQRAIPAPGAGVAFGDPSPAGGRAQGPRLRRADQYPGLLLGQ